jgi:transmembrane sensor
MKPQRQRTAIPAGHTDAEAKAIQRRAAEWLALRQARGFTLAEHASFADWCSADPRHPVMFAEVEAAWSTFDQLSNYPHSPDLPADPDLLAPRKSARVLRFAAVRTLLAAAAAIGVGAFVLTKPWSTTDSQRPATTVTHVDSRFLKLPDDSQVELNSGAEVIAHFSSAQRRVQLVRGEAHFTVTKNPERPFVVEANGVAVQAVGTAFNVRIDARAVQVLVTEGRVRLAQSINSGAPTRDSEPRAPEKQMPASFPAVDLVAGQRVVVPTRKQDTVDASPVVETLPIAEIQRALAWHTGRMAFDSTPLAEVVARFNRHLAARAERDQLVLGDAETGKILVSGWINSCDMASFVEVLESSFGVTAERLPDGKIALKRR